MIILKIISRRNCEPVPNVTVTAHFRGLLRGYAEDSTNRDGEVEFDNDPGEAYVYIRGEMVYHGRLEGYKTIAIDY